MKKESNKIAFALGGLAGNNAHGAGFLEAALDKEVEPTMISFTSGQILWVSRYLACRKSGTSGLRASLAEDIEQIRAFHSADLDLAKLSLFGKPGVFRPAGPAYMADAWRNAGLSMRHLLLDQHDQFVARRLLEVWPCRLLAPDFPDSFFDQICEAFNEEDKMGLVFNSYNPHDGCERVYLNEQARRLLGKKSGNPRQYKPGATSSYRKRTIYEAITPEAVRDALWLYQYGFDGESGDFLDGAYFRQIMLSELTHADTIYVVRPLFYHWSGELPQNWPEVEDLKTKVSFNGCYAGERHQIELVNKFLKADALKPGTGGKSKYHHIHLEEIEMKTARGFFGYVFEDLTVFDEAYETAMRRLKSETEVEPQQVASSV
jgi:hypothetical protein